MKDMVVALNAAAPTVFCVMDYFTFDGYLALRQYLKRADAVSLEKIVFPGIELRVESPTDFRLNIHCIFSDETTDQELRDFKSALRVRVTNAALSDEALANFARGLGEDDAREHGTTRADIKDSEQTALRVGFETAEVTKQSLFDAVRALGPEKCLVLIPWDTYGGLKELKWRDHPAAASEFMQTANIFESRDPLWISCFLGIKSDANSAFLPNFQHALGGHPKPVVAGSDAHRFSSYGKFPSGKVTWIKADPNFRGLLQILCEPAERTYIGEEPPKLEHVRTNPTKYIEGIRIGKQVTSRVSARWFESDLKLNPGLVAIIGNKGNGKSALADVLGLIANTKQHAHFSFLSRERFRNPRSALAAAFEGTVHWKDGTSLNHVLSDDPDPSAVERAKYLPQGYLEQLCNESSLERGGEFERELKKVIFAHLQESERAGLESLDELLETQSKELFERIAGHKTVIGSINIVIADYERKLSDAYRAELLEKQKQLNLELEAHEKVKPKEVIKPTSNTPELEKIAKELEELREKLKGSEAGLRKLVDEDKDLVKKHQSASKLLERLKNLDIEYQRFVAGSKDEFAALSVPPETVASLTLNSEPIESIRLAIQNRRFEIARSLDANVNGSAAWLVEATRGAISAAQSKLDAPGRAYAKYLADVAAWSKRQAEIQGTADIPNTLASIEARLAELVDLPRKLKDLEKERLRASLSIFNALRSIAERYRTAFGAVQTLVDSNEIVREEFRLEFKVEVQQQGFASTFFEAISQGNIGTFYGVSEGQATLDDLIKRNSFGSTLGVARWLRDIHKAVKCDLRQAERPRISVASLLKKGWTISEFYDWLFDLDYLRPTYSLTLGGKELSQLSPGERGTLLLVFYLLVDRQDLPVIIDQPEENLDNHTVYRLLVPVIREAKRHRQIVIVTHNANLAVVCDAEQIIHARLERSQGNLLVYDAGSIEAADINRRALDVLEGTRPAFNNRRAKYFAD
jgi:ABC-type lipoprotein export system ATPase subunit